MKPGGEQPMVSVVIAAYNAEKTLPKMLESVLTQTWQALQVIVVDDGSTDGTAAAARKAAEGDPRLTIITQKNRGVSSARNEGLKHCEGKYVRFADADDLLPPDSVEKTVTRMERDGAELVLGGYIMEIGGKSSFHNLAGRDDTISFDGILPHLNRHANSYFYGVLWNKLFLRETIEKLRCRFQEELTWGEDFAFVMDYLAGVNRIAFMRDALYVYRRSAGSASVRQVLDCARHPLDNIRVKVILYRHLKGMFIKRGQYEKYRKSLWHYLFRVGLG